MLFEAGQKVVERRRAISQNNKNKKAIWDAAVSLYVIGGLFLLVGLFYLVGFIARGGSLLSLIPLVIGVSFIALAVWSKKEEYWSILIGTILFFLMYLLVTLAIGFKVLLFLFFLPFGGYMISALFKVKKKGKANHSDVLDA